MHPRRCIAALQHCMCRCNIHIRSTQSAPDLALCLFPTRVWKFLLGKANWHYSTKGPDGCAPPISTDISYSVMHTRLSLPCRVVAYTRSAAPSPCSKYAPLTHAPPCRRSRGPSLISRVVARHGATILGVAFLPCTACFSVCCAVHGGAHPGKPHPPLPLPRLDGCSSKQRGSC